MHSLVISRKGFVLRANASIRHHILNPPPESLLEVCLEVKHRSMTGQIAHEGIDEGGAECIVRYSRKSVEAAGTGTDSGPQSPHPFV